MTKDTFENTAITAKTLISVKGKVFQILGFNYLSGTIRLKGYLENLTVDFSECEFVEKR